MASQKGKYYIYTVRYRSDYRKLFGRIYYVILRKTVILKHNNSYYETYYEKGKNNVAIFWKETVI